MPRIWEIFPEVVSEIRKTHVLYQMTSHHDFVHALRVGEMAKNIAAAEWHEHDLAIYAGLAGLCHNADRIIKSWHPNEEILDTYLKDSVVELFDNWTVSLMLPQTSSATFGYRIDIIEALLKHDRINEDEDSEILIALKDADRVVNLSLDMFIRSGQFYKNLPAVDYELFLDDPEATYRNPKSVLRDIAYSLDWVNPESKVCIRTEFARSIGTQYAVQYSQMINNLKQQLESEGIFPLPKIPD